MLVPESAHGTNPATAATCGYAVEPIPANARGRVDLAALEGEARPRRRGADADQPQHLRPVRGRDPRDRRRGASAPAPSSTATAPISTRSSGGCGRPISASTRMHINLHKTFSTPHGGGGPGSGPVVLAAALAPYAPLPWLVHGADGLRAGRARGRARPSAGDRAAQGLSRPDGHVRARARLHDEPRRRRAAPGRRGRGAERQLSAGAARRAISACRSRARACTRCCSTTVS